MKFHTKQQIIWILWTAVITLIGLILFKYTPMYFYGEDILFDASSHMAWSSWGLYVLWFFFDNNKKFRIPYIIFASMALTIMGVQRIIAQQHNEIGVMLGLAVAGIAIIIPRWKEFFKEVKF